MKTITTTAIVALMMATIGLSAIAPSYAQNVPATTEQQAREPGHGANFRQHNQGPRQGGFGGFLGFERGVEGVEIALVRLSHAIEMTAEQQALFETLKTDAIAAATTFSDAVTDLRPAAPAEGTTAERPDMSERLETRIAIETAHLTALEAIQPAATAFFDSLTDAQKAELMPEHGERGGMRHMGSKGGMRHDQAAPATGS